jgi:hypothetical protein
MPSQYLRVVELALISNNMRVNAARRRDVIVADLLPDPRPRHPGQVQQRDAAVAKIVRREVGDTCGGACASDGGSEAVAAEALKHGALRDAILARHEPRDGLEQLCWHRHPSGSPRLRHGT